MAYSYLGVVLLNLFNEWNISINLQFFNKIPYDDDDDSNNR